MLCRNAEATAREVSYQKTVQKSAPQASGVENHKAPKQGCSSVARKGRGRGQFAAERVCLVFDSCVARGGNTAEAGRCQIRRACFRRHPVRRVQDVV